VDRFLFLDWAPRRSAGLLGAAAER